MPFPHLLLFMLANFPGSLDSELQTFFGLDSFDENNLITEGAFSKARNHMNELPFKRMFKIVRNNFLEFEQKFLSDQAHGLIWCPVDGSKLALPNIPFLGHFFGTSGRGRSSPTALMSLIYDSYHHFIYDGKLAPNKFEYSEIQLALSSIETLSHLMDLSKSVFIFDRGYTDLKFVKNLLDFRTNFIIRVRHLFHGIQDLDFGQTYKVYFGGIDIPLRVAKFFLPSHQPEILVSNLFWPTLKEFKELYYLRWPVEIEFYFIKRVLRLEDFNGYTVNSIYQNFWISLTLANIVALIKMGADEAIQDARKDKNEKYEYETNLSEVITDLHTLIIKALISETDEEMKRCIDLMFEKAQRYIVPVRKDRKVTRKLARKASFHFNQQIH